MADKAYTYAADHRLLSAGDTSYAHDADGFLLRKTRGAEVTEYAYASTGELRSVLLPDGRLVEYDNDAIGRRVAKRIDGAIVEKYLWLGRTRLLAVLHADGSLKYRFEYADDRTPVAMTHAGQRFYLAYDQVGSLRAVTDASGAMVKAVTYDSFGTVLEDSNPALDLPFGFAGGLHDADTGLVRFGFRDYAPEVGRWTAKDPIGFKGRDSDLYGYCGGDPVNSVDSLGLVNAGATTWAGAKLGTLLGGPVGGVIGAVLGSVAGAVIGQAVWDNLFSKDETDCAEEWRDAERICREELDKPNPCPGITGGYSTVEDCARGLVSERCGGNPVE